jgi:hypothetical protein
MSVPFHESDVTRLGLPYTYTVPQQINTTRLELLLQEHPNRTLVRWAIAGLKYGFRLGHSGERSDQVHDNLTSAAEKASILRENIMNELHKGRVFKLDKKPDAPLFVSPLGVVPKPHLTKFCTINHMSFPEGKSVNSGIQSPELIAYYDRLALLANALRKLGPKSYMAKLDIEVAFRNLTVHPLDIGLQAFIFDGDLYLDLCLVFGCRASPAIFNAVAGLICWAARKQESRSPRLDALPR